MEQPNGQEVSSKAEIGEPVELTAQEMKELEEAYAEYEKPRKLRVLASQYEYDTKEEDGPGSLKDVIQHESHYVIWSGTASLNEFFNKLREEIAMPKGTYDTENASPTVGDSDYLYELQEFVDGKWENLQRVEPDAKFVEEE